jgi:hypothetical protein
MGHEESSCFLKNDKNEDIICSNSLFVVILQKINKLVMRRFFAIILSVMILLGCSQLSSYQHQLEMAEMVIEDNPDSAWVLLSDIPASLVSDGEERALYNLLLTEASYKLYKQIDSDSLITYSVDYYSQTGNQQRLATALYYKGGVRYYMEDKEGATFNIKQAEELAKNSDDELLKCKIYELLATINHHEHNHQLFLHYANLLLKSSLKLNRPMWLALAYETKALVSRNHGDSKQALDDMQLCMNHAEQCNDSDKVYIYTNYANTLYSEGKYSDARPWIEKAIQIKPLASQYVTLGNLFHLEGDTLQARLNWEKAVTMGDSRYTINAYKYLARLYNERRNYFKVSQMLAKADSVQIFYHEELRTTQLAEIQHRYDRAIAEKALAEQKNKNMVIIGIALMVLIVALLAIIYYQRRARRFEGVISDFVENIKAKEQRLAQLENSGKDRDNEIALLKANIENIKQASADRIGRGKELYELIAKREKPMSFNKENEQEFVDYYAYTFHEQYVRLVMPYHHLSLRLTCFLILQEMGYTYNDIADLLCVSVSAVRNYPQRLE